MPLAVATGDGGTRTRRPTGDWKRELVRSGVGKALFGRDDRGDTVVLLTPWSGCARGCAWIGDMFCLVFMDEILGEESGERWARRGESDGECER